MRKERGNNGGREEEGERGWKANLAALQSEHFNGLHFIRILSQQQATSRPQDQYTEHIHEIQPHNLIATTTVATTATTVAAAAAAAATVMARRAVARRGAVVVVVVVAP